MITPISFKSSYKVIARGHNVQKQKQFWKFRDFSDSVVRCEDGCQATYAFKPENKYPYFYKGFINLSVPDKLDGMVENYCNYHNIKYKKQPN